MITATNRGQTARALASCNPKSVNFCCSHDTKFSWTQEEERREFIPVGHGESQVHSFFFFFYFGFASSSSSDFVQEQEDAEEEAEATAVTSNLTSAKRKIPSVYLRFHRSASTSLQFSSDSEFETFSSRMRQHEKSSLDETRSSSRRRKMYYILFRI